MNNANCSTKIKIGNLFFLLAVFLLLSVVILFNGLYYQGGYLTADGCNYLALARNILEHGNFNVNLLAGEKEKAFFSIWPVGYPIMISCMAKVTGVSVFLASKITNILLVSVILYLLLHLFQEKAYIYSTLLFLIPFVEISSFTLTEISFVCGMLWLTVATIHFTESKQVSFITVANLTLACLFLFMSRYIGYFSVWFIGCLALYYFYKKNYSKFLHLIASATFSSVFICGYLYNNYVLTGYLTGMPRFSGGEGLSDMLLMISGAFLEEFNLLSLGYGNSSRSIILFILTLCLQLVLMYFILGRKVLSIQIPDNKRKSLYRIPCYIGLFYFVVLIGNRMTTYFSDLFYRMMFPGTFLILVGGISFVQYTTNKSFKKSFNTFILVIAGLSFLGAIALPFLREKLSGNEHVSYTENITRINDIVKDVPRGSVLVFGDRNLLYLRPDLFITSPYYLPFFPKAETWSEFLVRLDRKYPGKKVFAMLKQSNFWESANDEDLLKMYDETVFNFIKSYENSLFVQIR